MGDISESHRLEIVGQAKTQLSDCGVFVGGGPKVPATLFYDICRALGEIVRTDKVMLIEHATRYFLQPAALELHTDHPLVDYIGWYCVRQDEHDGAMFFVDGLKAIDASLSLDEIDELRHIEVFLPPVPPGSKKKRFWPVLKSGQRRSLYFVPWLPARGPEESLSELLNRLRTIFNDRRLCRNMGVRLSPGEFVIIDNKRILHGRDAIHADSPRQLLRVWIRASS